MAEVPKGISEDAKWNLFPFSMKYTRVPYGVCQHSKWNLPAFRWDALPPEVGNEHRWQGRGPAPRSRPSEKVKRASRSLERPGLISTDELQPSTSRLPPHHHHQSLQGVISPQAASKREDVHPRACTSWST